METMGTLDILKGAWSNGSKQGYGGPSMSHIYDAATQKLASRRL